jgi:hypothetical protein
VSPANEAKVGGTSITFTWSAAARANDYRLEVAADSGFTELVFGQWVGDALEATVPGSDLRVNGQVHFWRVAARNALGSSPFSSTWVFSPVCGDERDTIIQEYDNPQYIDARMNFKPTCSDFSSYDRSTYPWGIVRQELLVGLEATRTNYGGVIPLSSGYRCPHGNHQVGGELTSLHMLGRAADMCWAGQTNCGWTEEEFTRLKKAADRTIPPPKESFDWNTYPNDHHYHAAW